MSDCSWASPRLLAVDAAHHSVHLKHASFRRERQAESPRTSLPVVGGLDQALPQPRTVMGGGVRYDDLPPDDPVLPVHASVGLVFEHRDGDVDLLRAVQPELRLADIL